MNADPLISIIMPAYRAVNLIEQTIDSIRRQTYTNWELIIIDDLSADGTESVITKYQAWDKRIRYYCVSEHKGKPSIIRNIGLPLAKGSFITFMDADDVCFHDSLAVLITPLLKDSALNASIAFPLVCDSELNPIEYSRHLVEDGMGNYHFSSEPRLDWEKLCRTEVNYSLCCTMFPRRVIEQLGPLDEELITGEDYKYILSLLLLGFDKVNFIPAYTFKYRTYLGSTTKTPEKIIRHINCYVKVSNWLFSLPAMPEYYRKYKSEHLALMLSCLLASLSNMNRKDLAVIGLFKCSMLPDISLVYKLKFFGKELFRIAIPAWIQSICRYALCKQSVNYFSALRVTQTLPQ